MEQSFLNFSQFGGTQSFLNYSQYGGARSFLNYSQFSQFGGTVISKLFSTWCNTGISKCCGTQSFLHFSQFGGTQSFLTCFPIRWNTVIFKTFFNLVEHSNFQGYLARCSQ